MNNKNQSFGSLQGPFTANTQLFTEIQNNHEKNIEYISKLGIHYIGDIDLDLEGFFTEPLLVRINNIEFQVGKTRMLELEDTQITSIQFVNNTNDLVYIDYQYHIIEE